MELNITKASGGISVFHNYNPGQTDWFLKSIPNSAGNVKVEFTPLNEGTRNQFGLTCFYGTCDFAFDSIAVYPKHEVERTDLCFLESWEEDTSEKGIIYPFGNVQYRGGDTDGLTGIADGTFTGKDTYSLFGNWQAANELVGKGYVVSSLSAANLAKFVANPENNCYYDTDGKLIQVRYRIRTVAGLGDGFYYGGLIEAYEITNLGKVYGENDWLKPKGKLNTITTDLGLYGSFESGYYNNDTSSKNFLGAPENTWVAVNKSDNNVDTGVAYKGRCYALPIATVKRLNQGAFHPVFNSRGCGGFRTDAGTNTIEWYGQFSTSQPLATISCFVNKDSATAPAVGKGYITSGFSGRPDRKYSDAIYADQVVDLRLSAYKDFSVANTMQHLISGSARGVEGDLVTYKFATYSSNGFEDTKHYFTSKLTQINALLNNDMPSSAFLKRVSNYGNRQLFAVNTVTNEVYTEFEMFFYNETFYIDTGVTVTANASYDMYVSTKSKALNSASMLHCDIIGNVTRYPWTTQLSNDYTVSGTPLLVDEDGNSYLPDGVKKTFKLSKKANSVKLVLKSTDSGATWTSLALTTHYTIDTTTNTITYVTAPAVNDLLMVYYTTYPETVKPVVNTAVADGEIGDVWSVFRANYAAFTQSLINKVLTSNNYGDPSVTPLAGYHYMTGIDHRLNNNTYMAPYHQVLNTVSITSPLAVKALPYKTSDGVNVVFKEMKYDTGANTAITVNTSTAYVAGTSYYFNHTDFGSLNALNVICKAAYTNTPTAMELALHQQGDYLVNATGTVYFEVSNNAVGGWGDDNKFNIVDNVSTTVDDNGQTVLIGQKKVELRSDLR